MTTFYYFKATLEKLLFVAESEEIKQVLEVHGLCANHRRS